MTSEIIRIHAKYASFWAAGLVVLCATGLATIWMDLDSFWKYYALDMTGPAWNYILFPVFLIDTYLLISSQTIFDSPYS